VKGDDKIEANERQGVNHTASTAVRFL